MSRVVSRQKTTLQNIQREYYFDLSALAERAGVERCILDQMLAGKPVLCYQAELALSALSDELGTTYNLENVEVVLFPQRQGSPDLEVTNYLSQKQSDGPASEEDDILLTVKEVANRLRVDPTTILRWLKNGSLAGISFPEKREGVRQRQTHRIRQSVLHALLCQRPTTGERPR